MPSFTRVPTAPLPSTNLLTSMFTSHAAPTPQLCSVPSCTHSPPTIPVDTDRTSPGAFLLPLQVLGLVGPSSPLRVPPLRPSSGLHPPPPTPPTRRLSKRHVGQIL